MQRGKVVPFLDKILEDNELKAEIPHMFNYTSNGEYHTASGYNYNSDYITRGLYSNKDEDGITYYYRGNIENNYVQFGEYKEDYYVYRYEESWGAYDFVTLDSCQHYNRNCSESNRVLKYSAGTPMYWKIIRINGDESLKIDL